MATVRPPRNGPMQRQRISEKSFWSYCCARTGIAAAHTAKTPATRTLHARNCINHLLGVQEDTLRALEPQRSRTLRATMAFDGRDLFPLNSVHPTEPVRTKP